jgi:hypothetical protein
MLDLESQGFLERSAGELRYLDLINPAKTSARTHEDRKERV